MEVLKLGGGGRRVRGVSCIQCSAVAAYTGERIQRKINTKYEHFCYGKIKQKHCFFLQFKNSTNASSTRVSNMRPAGQIRPARVFNPARLKNFENGKKKTLHVQNIFCKIVFH